jgi:hypothetical protein
MKAPGLFGFVVLLAACPGRQQSKASAAALRAQAHDAYEAKSYRTCADLLARAARAAGKESAGDAYDAACCLALAADGDRALAKLEQAIDAGFRDLDRLRSDPDLAGLHDEARWARLLARGQAGLDGYLQKVNGELYRIYHEDQNDRQISPERIVWATVSQRDDARRARVREILDQGGARVADDYYHAAMVFQHGHEVADYQLAHQLALKAAELDPGNRSARWLAAATKDRELMQLGKPQRYGTQFHRSGSGQFELYQVDPTVTDEERARWEVPPLAEAKKRAARLNQGRP